MLAPGYTSFKLQLRICSVPRSYYPLHVTKGPWLFTEVTPDLEKSKLFTYKKVAKHST